MSEKKNVKDILMDNRKKIVDDIIKSIEENKALFIYGWNREALRPQNPVSGAKYNGINRLILGREAVIRGLDDPRWLTYNQAKEKGWTVKRGAKGVKCEKWIFTEIVEEERINENGQKEKVKVEKKREKTIPSYFVVFHASDIYGIPPYEKVELKQDEVLEIANNFIKSSVCPIKEVAQDRAYYSPSNDEIILPPKEYFKDSQSFLATALHEMGHSTGHPDRLNRDFSGRFGDSAYAREELTAELTAMFIQSDLGIKLEGEHFNSHAGYLESWVSVLKNDYQEFYRAINESQKASDFLYENYLEYVKENNIELEKKNNINPELFEKLEVVFHYAEHDYGIEDETTLKGIEAYKFLDKLVKFDKELTEKREEVNKKLDEGIDVPYIPYEKTNITITYGNYSTKNIRLDIGDNEFGKFENVTKALEHRLMEFPNNLLENPKHFSDNSETLYGKFLNEIEIREQALILQERISNFLEDFKNQENQYIDMLPKNTNNISNNLSDVDKLSIKFAFSEIDNFFIEDKTYKGIEAIKLLNELYEKERNLNIDDGYFKTRLTVYYDENQLFSGRLDLGDRITENISLKEKNNIESFINYYISSEYFNPNIDEKVFETAQKLILEKLQDKNIENLYLSDDKKDGIFKTWLSDNKYEISNYIDNKPFGNVLTYNIENNEKYISERKIIKEGEITFHGFYDKEGKLREERTYSRGQYTGLTKYYDENYNVISHKFEVVQTENKLNENGQKEGLWTELNGNTYIEIYNYKDGVKDGKYAIFNSSSGKLAEEGEYKEGVQIGELNKYYFSGEILSEERIDIDSNDKKTVRGNYYSEDGKYRTSEIRVNDSLVGTRYIIDRESNTVVITEDYSNNILSGERKEFYSNGRIKSRVNYINGKPDGNYVEYYDKDYSKVKSAGEYKDGKREGQWHWYYDTGELKRVIVYDKGSVPLDEDSLQYITREFYKNGKKKSPVKFDTSIYLNDRNKRLTEFREEVFNHNVSYSIKKDIYLENRYEENWNISGKLLNYGGKLNNNKMNGNHISFFFQTDKIEQEKNYKDGNLHGEYKEYYENGQLKLEANYRNGKEEDITKTYYKNGNLSFSYNFKDGKLDGIYKNLDENGNYIYIKEFKDGKSIGKSQYFEENKLKLEVEDLSNSENQVFFTNIEKHKLYYTNGQLMEEGIYKNFEKEGLWKKYDSEGKLIKEEYYKNGELQKEIKEPIKEEGRAIRGRATRGRGGNER